MSIRLSEKHGVNPCIELCFWCQEAKGVLLLGRLPGDAEAPREAFLNYQPCDKCVEKFGDNVQMIEVSDKPVKDGQMPIQKGVYPTGRWALVRRDALDKELVGDSKAVLVLPEDWKRIFDDEEEGGEGNEP
jgi:hypothetical protein